MYTKHSFLLRNPCQNPCPKSDPCPTQAVLEATLGQPRRCWNIIKIYANHSKKLNKMLIYRYLNVKYYYVQYCKKACFGLKKSGQKKTSRPAEGFELLYTVPHQACLMTRIERMITTCFFIRCKTIY